MAIQEIARPFQRWIFVSYSRRDRKWMERVLTHLKPLEQICGAEIFCDDIIDTGDDWDDTIKQHLQGANAAVLLVSADFLASKYISDNEFPVLLARAQDERGDLHVFPVIVSHALFDQVTFEYATESGRTERRLFSSIMAANARTEPLNCLPECEQEKILARMAREIAHRFRMLDRPMVSPSAAYPNTTGGRDVRRMPRGSSLFFGRDRQLQWLNARLADADTRIVMIVAQGGEGKSALVSHWLRVLESKGWADIGPAFAWSFYSQGTRDDRVAADDFILEALQRFNDPNPLAGHPGDKGRRLAELILKNNGLLILDGMEPLQESMHQEGRAKKGNVKDEAIAALLTTLAQAKDRRSGFCVVTTREPVALESADIEPLNLAPLHPTEGAWLLRLLGAKASPAELRRQSKQVGHHPLSLLLLGTFLRDIREIEAESDMPLGADEPLAVPIPCPVGFPPHLFARIASYEQVFYGSPHRDILLMLGLFDRPASQGELDALRHCNKHKGIPGLSDRVAQLGKNEWNSVVSRLRRAGLVNEASSDRSDQLDAHPYVREYFALRLRTSDIREAEKIGHAVLYEYLGARAASDQPSLLELIPLYQAVWHAARGEKLQEALKTVYWLRIQRERDGYAHRIHGAFATELTMLRLCFEDRYWKQPKRELDDYWQAYVLGTVGSRLRALGRLQEAAEPLLASRDRHLNLGHILHAAIRTRHLCELHVEMGQLEDAVKHGKRAIELTADIRTADIQKGEYQTKHDKKYESLVANVVLAAALHQMGQWDLANKQFLNAVDILNTAPIWPEVRVLFSLWGFRYCEYLFDKAEQASSAERAEAIAVLRIQIDGMKRITNEHVRDIPEGALGTLGPSLVELMDVRASLLDFPTDVGGRARILEKAEAASNMLRLGRRRDFMPLGLLTVSRIARQAGLFEPASNALLEAEALAAEGEMRLYHVDCLIEHAWLILKDTRETSDEDTRRQKAQEYYDGKIKQLELEPLIVVYGRRKESIAELHKALAKVKTVAKPRKRRANR
ncbi:MAG TPA: toll/interleukin-1 receptor domain-containing protein [Gemmataceae bacterium]|jgi:tetratricopeptide (TPR) repeat protein|nr:toll/interleukin-1 receptor domain-containing protein [Gemmataceae bacterium]